MERYSQLWGWFLCFFLVFFSFLGGWGLFKKRSSCRWFNTFWRSWDVAVILICSYILCVCLYEHNAAWVGVWVLTSWRLNRRHISPHTAMTSMLTIRPWSIHQIGIDHWTADIWHLRIMSCLNGGSIFAHWHRCTAPWSVVTNVAGNVYSVNSHGYKVWQHRVPIYPFRL